MSSLHKHAFVISSVESFLVESFLVELAERAAGGLVVELSRQPGARENRWMHLLSGAPVIEERVAAGAASAAGDVTVGEIAALKTNVARLEAEVSELCAMMGRLCAELGVSVGSLPCPALQICLPPCYLVQRASRPLSTARNLSVESP